MTTTKTTLLITDKTKEVDLSDTDKYLSVSAEDLNLYFADTFLLFEDSKIWEHVGLFEPDNFGNIIIKTQSPSLLPPRKLQNAKIRFAFPEVGLYNYKKGVISYKRKTLRQNKKGFCSSTAEMLNVVNLFTHFYDIPYGFLLSQTWKWIPPNVNVVFKHSKYPSFEEAHSNVLKLRDFARAISKDFFIGQGITSRYPSLWFHQTLIGKCPTQDQIIIENPIFLQEAVDYFLPIGVDIEEHSSPKAGS